MLYTFALGGQVLEADRHGNITNREEHRFALLRTCQQIRREAFFIPWSRNTFTFCLQRDNFCVYYQPPSECRAAIISLELITNLNDKFLPRSSVPKLRYILRVLDIQVIAFLTSFRGLKRLDIVVEIERVNHLLLCAAYRRQVVDDRVVEALNVGRDVISKELPVVDVTFRSRIVLNYKYNPKTSTGDVEEDSMLLDWGSESEWGMDQTIPFTRRRFDDKVHVYKDLVGSGLNMALT